MPRSRGLLCLPCPSVQRKPIIPPRKHLFKPRPNRLVAICSVAAAVSIAVEISSAHQPFDRAHDSASVHVKQPAEAVQTWVAPAIPPAEMSEECGPNFPVHMFQVRRKGQCVHCQKHFERRRFHWSSAAPGSGSAAGSTMLAPIQAMRSLRRYRIVRPTRTNAGPEPLDRQACKVLTDSRKKSAASTSVRSASCSKSSGLTYIVRRSSILMTRLR